MTKAELIAALAEIPDDAPVLMWNGMDLPVPVTVVDSGLIHGKYVTVIDENTVDEAPWLIREPYEGPTVVLDSRPA